MTIATELDGKYTVTSHSGIEGPTPKESDGFTIIKGGKTSRIDGAGCEWTSSFEWIDQDRDKVKMVSVVDPKYAVDEFRLKDAAGRPTAEAQSYETVLNVRIENNLHVITGIIDTGFDKITLMMRQARD